MSCMYFAKKSQRFHLTRTRSETLGIPYSKLKLKRNTMEPSASSQDKGGGSGQPFRLRVMLEPKGFIRIIEFGLAVLMFATTAGYSSLVRYIVNCKTYPFDKKYEFGYPFDFKPFDVLCDGTNVTDELPVPAYPGAKASFFVAIGVLAMLYCIVSLVWYVFFEVMFLKLDLVPVADLALTAVFTIFFFLASCAWASGVTTVKYWTNFDNIIKEFYPNLCANPNNSCTGTVGASYASLNVSIIFGFLNVTVWLGNCWFVYKETVWFKDRQGQKQQDTTEEEAPPNDV